MSSAIVKVDPTSEVAVTSYLQQARDWLATAVENTGPEQIAAAKAEIATAAEATKQLRLSKEIRDDATEMVRRAEYALGKAIRKGQSEGTLLNRGGWTDGHRDETSMVKHLVQHPQERHDIYQMSDGVESESFDQALDQAKVEGNLSRANVIRKIECRTQQGERAARATRRKPLTDFAWEAAYDLEKVAEKLQRVVADDRFQDNRAAIAGRTAGPISSSGLDTSSF